MVTYSYVTRITWSVNKKLDWPESETKGKFQFKNFNKFTKYVLLCLVCLGLSHLIWVYLVPHLPVYPELPHQSCKAHCSYSHLWHNDHKSHYKNSKTFQSVPSKFWFTVHTLLAVQKLVIKKVNKLPQLEPWWVMNPTVPMDSERQNVKIMVKMNFVRPNE